MSSKPPYLSGGRGRGQNSQRRTGYAIGNLVIDRKAENKKAKVNTKPITATDTKNITGKRKQQQVDGMLDARHVDSNTEMNNDTLLDGEQESHQEQILENIIKSYKKGNNDSKDYNKYVYILTCLLQSGSGTDARNIVRLSADELAHLHHLLGVDWPTRSSRLLTPMAYDIITIHSFDRRGAVTAATVYSTCNVSKCGLGTG